MGAESHGGSAWTIWATGHGVVRRPAGAALAHTPGGGSKGATVAIEGFGKVGAGTASAPAHGPARESLPISSLVHGGSSPTRPVSDVEQLLEHRLEHASATVSSRNA